MSMCDCEGFAPRQAHFDDDAVAKTSKAPSIVNVSKQATLKVSYLLKYGAE